MEHLTTTILLCTTALTISPKTESEPLYHASPTLNGLEIVIQARWILYRFVKVVVHFSGCLVCLCLRLASIPLVWIYQLIFYCSDIKKGKGSTITNLSHSNKHNENILCLHVLLLIINQCTHNLHLIKPESYLIYICVKCEWLMW